MAPSHAIDRIAISIARLSAGTFQAKDISGEVVLSDTGPARAALHLSSIATGKPLGTLYDVSVSCAELTTSEARIGCPAARARARGGPSGSLAFGGSADYDGTTGALTFAIDGLALAGGRVALEGRLRENAWSLDTRLRDLAASELRKLGARWIELPRDWTLDGRLAGRVRASGGTGTPTSARLDLTAREVNFTNEDGTLVAENVSASLAGSVRLPANGPLVDLKLSSRSGQALAGPVLLDLNRNPAQMELRGAIRDGVVHAEETRIHLQHLLSARGSLEIATGPALSVRRARLAVEELRFPAAYTSFMQLTLAATDFGTLETSGSVSGEIEIAGNALARLDAVLAQLRLEDARGKFSMHDVRGALHWSADGSAPVAASHLEWSRGSAYGLSGGAARVDFRGRGRAFELTRETRLPIFDGALRVRSLALREIGERQAELDFDAVIEPISMPLLSRAFGWPELSGRLSGAIPGLTYRNQRLTVVGDLQAQVFDGLVTGSNFRLQDPLGPWPRLVADITARSLDLGLVTRTFSIGSITGRLNADIGNLELFNWSPVAFDARLYSTPGDRSPHRISQKAVTAISSIGGGGGGVAKALQSGVLRFFDEFRYDRIGINCRLRNEVCLMSGIERAGVGYYIVKGSGLPRIDIIGTTGRVDWPQLVSQIVAGMRAEGVQVR